jgi:hypothetical protein
MQNVAIKDCPLSIDDKVKLIEQTIVQSPRFKDIIEKIEECHCRSKLTVEPRCMLIIGDTGLGKTTIGEFYAERHPRIIDKDGTTIPVLYSIIPSGATVKSLAERLLEDIGDPLYYKGTKASMTSRFCRLVVACGVQLIILDEFQHIIDRDSLKVLHSTADWLKEILNRTKVPVILIGMPSSVSILTENAQLMRRFAAQVELKTFEWQPQEERNDFLRFLKVLEQAMPMSKPSKLYAEDMALRVFCATKGITSRIKNLISKAAQITYEKGLECITMGVLALAYDKELAVYDLSEPNPFQVECGDLKLPERTQNSQISDEAGGRRGGNNKKRTRAGSVANMLHK